MSSTNRGGQREASDYYVTPAWAIADFLTAFMQDAGELRGGLRRDLIILDPCAGGDAKHGMAYPDALRKFGLDIQRLDTVDIRLDSLATFKFDYLAPKNWGKMGDLAENPDIIITNPPFALALPIIQKALQDVRLGGLVIMLLRLNFFGSKERKPFFTIKPPHGIGMPLLCYVHSKRMSFTGGKTDSIEYCHMVWQQGNNPKFTKLRII